LTIILVILPVFPASIHVWHDGCFGSLEIFAHKWENSAKGGSPV
jgi:hypothetical protein